MGRGPDNADEAMRRAYESIVGPSEALVASIAAVTASIARVDQTAVVAAAEHQKMASMVTANAVASTIAADVRATSRALLPEAAPLGTVHPSEPEV